MFQGYLFIRAHLDTQQEDWFFFLLLNMEIYNYPKIDKNNNTNRDKIEISINQSTNS